ncbi:MAG: hypothetical protein KGP29_02340 [Proteobacteria bacterium]|nr:hypothetical protein [Pseudomonadota bacterium]
MSKPNRQERIRKFEGLIAKCEAEGISLRHSRGSGSVDVDGRKSDALAKIEGLLSEVDQPDDFKKTLEDFKKEAPKDSSQVAVVSDLPSGFKESTGESTEWYSDRDISRVLTEEIKSRSGVELSGIVQVSDDSEAKELFKSQFQLAIDQATKGDVVMIPINLSKKHWIGGVMRMNEKGELEFIYNDSLGDSEGSELEVFHSKLKGWIGELSPEVTVTDLGVRQQNDGHNCGPFTIHNLLALADNRALSAKELKEILGKQIDPKELRKKHELTLAPEPDDRDDAEKMWSDTRDWLVCLKMRESLEMLREEGRISEGGKINCEDETGARKLAENLKKSYEDIGVKPCRIEQKGDVWVVRLPQECRGRDPFSMDIKELKELKEELRSPAASVMQTSVKQTDLGASLNEGISTH